MKKTKSEEFSKNKSGLSNFLFQRRRVLDIDLEDVSQKTGIQVKYLRRMEKGEWSKLPSGVYVKGFLRKYARIIGCNSEELVKAYEKEILEENLKDDENKPRESYFSKLKLVKDISPRTFRITLVSIVFLVVLGYIGYQVSAVFSAPELKITEPQDSEVVIIKDSTAIKGEVGEGVDVFINNELVSLNSERFFNKEVDLLPGLNIFSIKAVSRFGKETTINRRIIYQQ